MTEIKRRVEIAVTLALLALVVVGCGHQPNLFDEHGIGRPRPRVGRYATDTIGGASWLDPNRLGAHGYYNSLLEGTGIVYTCRAGHVDLAHTRKSADWTAYIAERTFAMIKAGGTRQSLILSDPVRYSMTLNYPCDWDERPAEERDELAREASIAIGQYVSYLGSIWHEIITWFGYRNVPLYAEFPSSFSWEDSFSDLLGSHLGAAALRDTEHSFDKAMTLILKAEMDTLGAQPTRVALRASRAVKGQWYSPGFLFLLEMKKRNLDIGLDDGFITPWIVPSVNVCPKAEPLPYAIPTLAPVFDLGFWVKVEIEPGGMERDRLLRAAYPGLENPPRTIVPTVHFHPIMEHIKKEAVEKYGPDVDVPWPEKTHDPNVPVATDWCWPGMGQIPWPAEIPESNVPAATDGGDPKTGHVPCPEGTPDPNVLCPDDH
jgi:Protein of unknown function (DUF4056)